MRVLIAGGGTGGHFYPGLAVAQALQAQGVEVFWLGARQGIEARKLPEFAIPHRLLAISGAVGVSWPRKLASFLRLVPALGAARAFLARVQAQVVLSVGGFAAFPGGAAAASSGIPLVVQEQNAFPGLVHRLLAPWAAAIACGFPTAPQAFASLPARWTGNPVRREFFQLPAAPARRALLVLGGSQGSQKLNHLLPQALASLPQDQRPQVLHQAGEKWEEEVKGRYAQLGVAARVVGFLPRPWEELAQVPLVVARAGALTVSELAAAQRAAILIPFAQAAHGHQLANARALEATGAAWVLEESQATPQALAGLLAQAFAHLEALPAKGAQGKALARPQAAQEIAQLVLRLGRRSTGEAA
jgi:UDP-N-acetylglucosamine--N-acetylmuramyl-(pentapeptide) pyrophosphoryl-undecaprenol N-acetylglucosamine transferase